MSSEKIDVLTMGNAMVDHFASVEDHELRKYELTKGIMHLVDEARSQWLQQEITASNRSSGGSAANTAVGVAALGGRSAFIGKVRNDPLGHYYADHMVEEGVVYQTELAQTGDATGACFVLNTPDGERTMNTFLGAGQSLSVADIDAQEALIAAARVTYFEGYLWDPPEPKKAFLRAAEISHEAGNEVAITLSDAFCVDRYRDEFRQLIAKHQVDLVFANEDELLSLYQTDDFAHALRQISAEAKLGIITRGDQGCVVVEGAAKYEVEAEMVEEVVDTTGAGDQFAAGFLYGYSRGLPHEVSAGLGALAAAEVISHIGARPVKNLKRLALAAGLLR